MQMLEAFRALNALNEDTFSLDADGIEKLSNFTQNDDLEDDVQIIDPEAETEEDLQDNYIGKVILDCCVCHSKLYKEKSEVDIDETGELANVGEECPYCFTPDGFKVIGEVVAFGEESEEDEETESEEEVEASEEPEEVEEEEEVKTESLQEAAFSGGVAGDNSASGGKKMYIMHTNGWDGFWGLDETMDVMVDPENKSKPFAGSYSALLNMGLQESFGLDEDADMTSFINAHGDKIKKVVGQLLPDNLTAAQRTQMNNKFRAMSGSVEGSKLKSIADQAYNNKQANVAAVSKEGNNLNPQKNVNESIEDLSMTANGTHVDVSEEENGKVTVTMEPATNEAGGEMIAPVSPEAEAEIMSDEFIEEPTSGEPVEDIAAEEGSNSEIDADFDEFDEESMDGLGESYFKRVYENVNSFKTTAVKTSGNSMIIEGLLEFTSGNKKSTSFIFEALDATKTGKFRFVGDNKELTEGKKAFMLTGTIKNNKLMVESMNYNYKHIDAEGKTSRVYGTERIK